MAVKKPEASKKAENKAKAKIIEDKTFGLKNKNKSAKVSKYVQQIEQQVNSAGNRKLQKEEEAKALARKMKKEEEERRAAELALISRPVIVQPKVPFGSDPKSVLCAYFKAGQCSKGDKCKFSHDLSVDRKSAKIDIYSDIRNKEEKENDTMDKWDQEKLENVVLKRHGPGIKTTTDIVCKYFLEAIEDHKYGWFWECPNGGNSCKYKHALPPGFVLKSRVPSTEDTEEESISIEEFLETERHKLGNNLTPVTLESFMKWKENRIKKQEEEDSIKAKKKESDVKAGKMLASGRELFTFNPDLFHLDDDEAMDNDLLLEREEDPYDLPILNPENEDLFLDENLENLTISDNESDIDKGV